MINGEEVATGMDFVKKKQSRLQQKSLFKARNIMQAVNNPSEK